MSTHISKPDYSKRTSVASVVVRARLGTAQCNVLLDTGAGPSIIDQDSMKKLNLARFYSSETSIGPVFDASGNRISVIGALTLPIVIGPVSCTAHPIQVVNTSHRNLILGRDFMSQFDSTTFHWSRNEVAINGHIIKGVAVDRRARVTLAKNVEVPPRTELLVHARCNKQLALLNVDFDPCKHIPGVSHVYPAHACVSPDMNGIFQVKLLNVTDAVVKLNHGKFIGHIKQVSEVLRCHNPELTHSRTVQPTPLERTAVKMGDTLTKKQGDCVWTTLSEFPGIFAENPKKPGRTHLVKHPINTGTASPIKQSYRRIPHGWEEEIKLQVTEMAQNDVIRPSQSPWSSPIILVKKKDGSTRFVLDYRRLNDVTKKDAYPLPNIQDVLDRMAGAKYWTTLDCASGYWAVPLEEADKEKTAFSIPRGKFEFNVMPFGLCNSPATFQRLIDVVLSGLSNEQILAYIDDIVLFSSTFEEHIHQLRKVLARLTAAGLTLKVSKCQFAMAEVDFLGYHLSTEGIRPQSEHLEVIRDFPEPTTKREVKRFLGMAGFYRQFVPNFSAIARPLTNLTGDHVPFQWSENCQSAFDLLKLHLQSQPVLAFPRWNHPFIIECDASQSAVGGVLSQADDNEVIHVVAYFSKALSPSQRKWSTTEKECFALIQATRKWEVYLRANPFTLYTDHNPLVWLRKQKDPRGKFARWTVELEQFEYSITYKPGSRNDNADCLSRNPKHQTTSDGAELENEHDPFEEHILVTTDNDFHTKLAEEQKKDPVLGPCWRLVNDGKSVTQGRYKRISNQLRMVEGVLTKAGRPMIPACLREFIVSQLHSVSHVGVDKTYSLVKDRFYWYGMYNYVKNFTYTCETCQQVKSPSKAPRAPLLPIAPEEHLPMRAVAIDIATLPKTDDGYRYFLVIGDTFSKYLEAVPMKNQTADTVVKAFWRGWVTRHGCPTTVLSDQGKNVDGATMKILCDKFGIAKKRSSSYHPAGNGFAERSIRSIKQILTALLTDRGLPQKSWKELLPEVLLGLRIAENESTKCSPFSVVHGRDPLLPHDVMWNTHNENEEPVPVKVYGEEVRQRLTDVFQKVANQLAIARKKMKFQHDKQLHVSELKPGQRVWIKRKWTKRGQSKSLSTRWLGPWIITKQMANGVNFEISNPTTGALQIVHHDRIRATQPPASEESAVTILPQENWEFESPTRRKRRNQDNHTTLPSRLWPGVIIPTGNAEGERDDINEDEQLPDLPQNEDMELAEDEQQHPLPNNDLGEADQPIVEEESQNDELPLQGNIQPQQLERRYPVRRRTQRQLPNFINWDEVPPDMV